MTDIEIRADATATAPAPAPSDGPLDDHNQRLEAAVSYLRSREKFGIKFGLQNIDRLCELLGRPERCYPSILVAGTNGKGSTVALLASILQTGGYRTGRYTSPHIRRLEERITVDGDPIPPVALAEHVEEVERAARVLSEQQDQDPSQYQAYEPTFFEAVTACAFLHFRGRAVDLAVFEVGMGGRYDATNILHAAVSVITPIGFDHERFLGSTIQEIASEKAAIIKTGRPVVVGALEPEALAVVENEASHRGARVIRALDGVRVHAKEVEGGQLVELQTPACDYGSFTLPILGRHQLDNLVVAVRVAELAHEELGLPRRIDPDTVRAGVEAARWPGRLERRGGRPVFLLDAAHNIMAAERLADYLESHPHANRVLLFGVMKDKRVHEMLGQLLPHVSAFVATRPEMSRAREPAELAAWARDRGFAAESVPDSRAALDRARTLAGETGEVVVAGSIFLLGEIVEAMEERRERHKNKTSP